MHTDHYCEALVESPEDEGQFVRCRILSLNYCSVCGKWMCGDEELMHLIACAKCDHLFCPEDYRGHVCRAELSSLESTIVP